MSDTTRSDTTRSGTRRGRGDAAMAAIGPFFLLAAIAYHPFIANLTDNAATAAALSADTARWAIAHIAVGVGFAFLLLALLVVARYLGESGEQRWSARAVPFLVLGTTLFTFLPAMETAMVAASRAGADAVEVQTQLGTWFRPLMIAGALTFGAGLIFMAISVVRSRVFSPELTRIIAVSLIIATLSRFAPLGGALYLGAAAGVVALVPIAIQMWNTTDRFAPAARPIFAPNGGAR